MALPATTEYLPIAYPIIEGWYEAQAYPVITRIEGADGITTVIRPAYGWVPLYVAEDGQWYETYATSDLSPWDTSFPLFARKTYAGHNGPFRALSEDEVQLLVEPRR